MHDFKVVRQGREHNESQGKVIQRLPKKDWDDYRFETQVEMFCQPSGWELYDTKSPPTFFVAYLTDTEASLYYVACLSFHEAVSPAQLAEGKHNSTNSSLNKKIQLSNGSGGCGAGGLHHVRNLSSSSFLQANGDGKNNFFCCSDNECHDGDAFQEDPNLVKPANKFAPKSLILLSRHGNFDVLKNCLSIIYSIYMDPHREISLEYVVSNILSNVDVPPIGGSRISFTIGAGDKQVIQPSLCPTLPVTRCCISMLFKHLGMQNVLLIFTSLINDQKILLYSRSLNRLTEACHALRSLLYPLKYGNVFIPIIPKALIDVLSTPTPFLAGVHSHYRPMYDLNDVIMVDLDGGSVKYPEGIPLVQLSEPCNTIVIDSLTKILNPDLLTADEIYTPPASPPPDPVWQDKQLRAVFIRLFCRLFAGYRSCLTLTRIRPRPVIHFNQLIFLLLRGLRNDNDDFIPRLLNCMSFGQFIQDRGTPYRVCDVFDEEYDSMTELLRTQPESLDELAAIDRLAKKLNDNENRGPQIQHHLPSEARLGHTRLYAQPFQLLDDDLVAEHIKTNRRNKTSSSATPEVLAEPRFVPHGLELDKQIFKNEALSDKNKVIREFVANIFNNHITEALKRRNTIRQDLKNRLIRRIFIDELYRQLYPDPVLGGAGGTGGYELGGISSGGGAGSGVCTDERKALLEYQQFELVNDLMGEALRQEARNEDSGVGPIVMDLSTKFCTQLNNIRYYSNMTWQIQEHQLWESQKFWINCFCDQVNNEIRQLYLHHSELSCQRLRETQTHPGNLEVPLSSGTSGQSEASTDKKHHTRTQSDRSWSHSAGVVSQPSLASVGKKSPSRGARSPSPKEKLQQQPRKLYTNAMSALDMAAEEMKIIDQLADSQVQQQENSTIFAQILHFINLIVNLRIPLNIVARTRPSRQQQQQMGDGGGGSGANNNSSQTGPGHGSHHHHHGHHQHDYGDDMSVNSNVSGGNYNSDSSYDDARYASTRISNLEIWLKKFVDKTASDNNLSSAMIDNIKSKIEGIIEGHISNLETIYPEVQNIPKVKKVEVTSPVLLPEERVILINGKESLRCHLLLDGRHEKLDMHKQREPDLDFLVGNAASSAYVATVRPSEDEDDFDALRPLLPAQGALFLTNYRVVFRGAPKDPYQSNKLVCRSFPIAGLLSVKKLGMKTLTLSGATTSTSVLGWNLISGKAKSSRGGDGCLDVIRIRSNTCQMLKIGIEPEDSSQEIKEQLTNTLIALRYPPSLSLSFNVTQKIGSGQVKDAYWSGLPDDLSSGAMRRQISGSVASSSVYSYQVGRGGANQQQLPPSSLASGSAVWSQQAQQQQQLQQQHRGTLRNAKEGLSNRLNTAMMKVGGSHHGGGSSTGPHGRVSPSTTVSKSKTISESDSEMSSAQLGINHDEDGALRVVYNKLLDELQQLPGYMEYHRMGIPAAMGGSKKPVSVSSQESTENGRDQDNVSDLCLITDFNERHHNIKSYPAMLVVPSSFTEAKLRKVAKNYRKSRLPIVTWRSPNTKALLIRGAAFQAKNFMGRLLGPPGSSAASSASAAGTNSSGGSAVGHITRTAAATLQKPESELTSSTEQVRYLQELVRVSPGYEAIQRHLLTVDQPLVPWTENCRQLSVQTRKKPFEKAYKNIKASGEKAKTLIKNEVLKLSSSNDELNRTPWLSPALNRKNSHDSIASSQHYTDDHSGAGMGMLEEDRTSLAGGLDDCSSAAGGTTGGGSGNLSELRLAPLYLLGEKAVMKSMSKWDSLYDVEMLAVDYATKSQVRDAYESLLKAALPDNVSTISSAGQFGNPAALPTTSSGSGQQSGSGGGGQSGGGSAGQAGGPGQGAGSGTGSGSQHNSLPGAATRWLSQVQSLLELSGAVVDLMDVQAASVGVCLEEGCDITAQVVSLAQVMMDPHYRTIAGFWALVDKDWLSAGHRFLSRLCLTSTTTSKSTALTHGGHSATGSSSGTIQPIFLQFLDAVHQLLRQFPLAFEFNDFFLRFLAYHHVSNRFNDFKQDCESERVAWLQQQSLSTASTGTGAAKTSASAAVHGSAPSSIWHYIQTHHDEWPVFFNFHFCPDLAQKVLRPCTNLAMIDIWEYYLNEDLASGSVYDLDHFSPSYRKRNSQHYDPVLNGAFNNSHVEGVYAILGLREGCEVRNWRDLWQRSSQETQAGVGRLRDLLAETGMLHGGSGCGGGSSSDTTLTQVRRGPPGSPGVTELHQRGSWRHSLVQLASVRAHAHAEHRLSSLRRLQKRQHPLLAQQQLDTVPADLELLLSVSGNSNGATASSAIPVAVSGDADSLTAAGHRFQRLPTQLQFQIRCEMCQNRASVVPAQAEPVVLMKCVGCGMVCHDKCVRVTTPPCPSASPRTQQQHQPTGSTVPGNVSSKPSEIPQRPPPPSTSITIAAPATSSTVTASHSVPALPLVDQHPTAAKIITRPSQPIVFPSTATTTETSFSSAGNSISATNNSSRNSTAFSAYSDGDKYNRKADELAEQSTESVISGELWKLNQHTLFPSWQKKFFVLDAIRHAILYYDLKDSAKMNRKRIDLQDITGVRILTTIPNYQKKFPESAFLELQTEGRTYKLAADSPATISEWVEKIQTSIQ